MAKRVARNKKDVKTIHMGFKYRAYPNEDQKAFIEKQLGACRHAYNYVVRVKEELYKRTRYFVPKVETTDEETTSKKKRKTNSKHSNYSAKVDIIKDLRPMVTLMKEESWSWMKDVISDPVYEEFRHCELGYNRYYAGIPNAGLPKFKSKRASSQSFQFASKGSVKVDFDTGLVTFPKIGAIPIIIHRPFVGTPGTITVTKKSTGAYYITVMSDTGRDFPETQEYTPHTTIGIDVGLSTYGTLSTGEKIENPRFLSNAEKRIKVLSRRLSKKVLGSNNWKKASMKIGKLHEHVANQRSDFLHNLSTRLVRENQAIIVEDLNIKGLKRTRMAKSISDVSWGEFFRQLEYKCSWYGKTFDKVPRNFPSTKLCHICGFKKDDITLSDREWTCPSCSTHHDRDINAAINIKMYKFAPSA